VDPFSVTKAGIPLVSTEEGGSRQRDTPQRSFKTNNNSVLKFDCLKSKKTMEDETLMKPTMAELGSVVVVVVHLFSIHSSSCHVVSPMYS
jgi:hypothetical protein